MSKTYLVGYYGMKNSGDDALLAAATWGAKRYLGSNSFFINSPIDLEIACHGKEEAILVGKQLFPAQNRLRQYKTAIKSNNVLFGGGSVLQNQRDIDLKRDLLTLTGSSNNIALGVGIGPFENIKAEKSCVHLLNHCQFVGVRDQISLDIAKSIAPRADVRLTFDLAPTLLDMKNISPIGVKRQGIAVCLCPHERLKGSPDKETQRLKEIANALRMTYFATGEHVTFIDFNGHPTLGDEKVHKEISKMISDVPYRHVKYNSDPFKLLQLLGSYKAIISMRLHAAIFGFLAETPVISLNYHEKCLGWCKQVGMPKELYFSLSNINSENITDQLCNGLQFGFSKNTMDVSIAKTESNKNWSMANEYLSCKNNSSHSFI